MRRECDHLVKILINEHPEGRAKLKPLVDEYHELEDKGFNKLADDLIRI
jgi:hypothetical protein